MKFYKNVTKTLVCIFLFLLLIPFVRAGDPSYSLLVYSNSNVLNPGELNKIWIFVGGKGKITDNLIHIDIPHQLVKDGFFEGYEPKISCEEGRCFYIETDNWINYSSRYHLNLEEEVFKPSRSCRDLQLSACGIYNGETTHLIAPFNIRFEVDKKAKPGDYVLKFNLYYQDENGWHHDEDTVIIHVTTFYERKEMILWSFGIIIAISSLILRFKNIRTWIRQNFVIFIVFLLLIILVTFIIVLFLVFMTCS